MKKAIIFGTGDVASTVYSYLKHDSPYEVVAFTVDASEILQPVFFDCPLVPFEEVEKTYPPEDHEMMVALGFRDLNALRAKKYGEAKAKGYTMARYISSSAFVSPDAQIGDNCMICPMSMVLPYTEIGDNVNIGEGTLVGHHVSIGDHCWITSGAQILGNVSVREQCFLGGGSVIKNNVTVAANCVIGAGALILENTVEGDAYMGSPSEKARPSQPSAPDQLRPCQLIARRLQRTGRPKAKDRTSHSRFPTNRAALCRKRYSLTESVSFRRP